MAFNAKGICVKTLLQTHFKSFVSAAALTLLTFGLTGCAPEGGSAGSAASGAKPLTIGFIYVGPKDDYGYNQAHAAGRRRRQEDARRQGHGRGKGPGDRSTSRRP